jgi:hypothetical protein
MVYRGSFMFADYRYGNRTMVDQSIKLRDALRIPFSVYAFLSVDSCIERCFYNCIDYVVRMRCFLLRHVQNSCGIPLSTNSVSVCRFFTECESNNSSAFSTNFKNDESVAVCFMAWLLYLYRKLAKEISIYPQS